jgi:steroid 5-alpha reductase family enzyme
MLQSTDGIKCDMLIFRAKNWLSNNVYLRSFEVWGNIVGFLCSCIYPQATLLFLADGSIVGLGGPRVKGSVMVGMKKWTKHPNFLSQYSLFLTDILVPIPSVWTFLLQMAESVFCKHWTCTLNVSYTHFKLRTCISTFRTHTNETFLFHIH